MANVYRYARPVYPEAYRVDTDVRHPWHYIEMGMMLQWDAPRRYAKPLNSGCEDWFIGVAEGVTPTPAGNIDNAPGLEDTVRVRQQGIFHFKTTAGQIYNHGDPVKMGADEQTVDNTGVTSPIGWVWRPRDATSLTGAAGTDVDVAIVARFPASGQDINGIY
jgi:predicted RecA/RadA family phage recombinase